MAEPGADGSVRVQPGQPAAVQTETAKLRARRAVMDPGFMTWPPADRERVAAALGDSIEANAIRFLDTPAFRSLPPTEKLKVVRHLPGFSDLDPRAQASYLARLTGSGSPRTFGSLAERLAERFGETATPIQQTALDIAEGAVKVPAGIGRGVLTVANLGLKDLGVPTEKVLQPLGRGFEAAAQAARELLPDSWKNPESTSTLVNFLKILPDFTLDVSGKWIRENVEALDSLGAVASIGLTAGAAAAIRRGAQLALAGNVAAGTRVIAAAVAEGVASPAKTAKAVAKGVGELATGIPARSLPETLGAAVAGPAGSALRRGLIRAGDKVTLPASIAEPFRRYAAPKNLNEQLLRGPATVTRVTTELMAPIGSTLPPALQPARRVMLAESEQGLKASVDRMRVVAARHMKPEARAAASQIVEAQLASRAIVRAGAQDAAEAATRQKGLNQQLAGLSRRLKAAGVPKANIIKAMKQMKAEDAARAARTALKVKVAAGAAAKVGRETAARLAKQFPDALPLAQEIVQNTNTLRRELVAAGFPPEAFQRFIDAYIGRFYLAKELPTDTLQKVAEALGNGKIPAGGITVQDAARLMERGDLPQSVRDDLMEITDAGYREVRTIAQEKSLAAFGRFQQSVVKAGVAVAKEGPGLVKLGDGARMIPALAGKWVPLDVAREIALFDGVVLEYASENFARKAMSLWKEVVTVDNPAVWTGNIITNFALLDMHRIGGPLGAPGFLVRAARDMIGAKAGWAVAPEYALARKMGLFDEASSHRNALRSELARFIAEDIDAGTIHGMAIQHASTMHRPAWRKWITAAREGVQAFYRTQDDIFKYVAFKDGLKRGLKSDAALVRAREMFVDYSSLPMAVRRIGSSPIGVMPFISWQYGITPQLLKGVTANPFALQRWSHAMDAWNSAAAMSIGDPPETLDLIKEARVQAFDWKLARFFADNMVLMILPVRTAAGDLMVIDLTRFNPYGTLISGRALSLSPAVLGFLELATGTRYYGTTPVGPIRSSEAIAEAARVLAIPPPVAAQILKIGLALAARSTDPATRNGAIRAMKVMFGTQGFGSPYGKPQSLLGQIGGIAGIRVVPTALQLERTRAAQRIERRLQGAVGVEASSAMRETLFRRTLPPIQKR